MFISPEQITSFLELVFRKYHHRQYVSTDPLKFLYHYDNARDREIVGIIASSLAYGRVSQILKTIRIVLDKIGFSPYDFVRNTSYKSMCHIFEDFKYRFTKGEHLAALLFGIKKVLYKFGSLNNCFQDGFKEGEDNIKMGLTYFVDQLTHNSLSFGNLIPNPKKKSACKRLNLFLRWMVRNDNIDIGDWSGIPTSMLVVPLDTHMHNIGINFGFTKRRHANFKVVSEITSGFKVFSYNDPVKYDFSLTRLGILKNVEMYNSFFNP